MSKQKAKQGTPYDGKCFGAYVRQVAPNEHVKNGDFITSSTSGRKVQVGSGQGAVKGREPECCDLDGDND